MNRWPAGNHWHNSSRLTSNIRHKEVPSSFINTYSTPTWKLHRSSIRWSNVEWCEFNMIPGFKISQAWSHYSAAAGSRLRYWPKENLITYHHGHNKVHIHTAAGHQSTVIAGQINTDHGDCDLAKASTSLGDKSEEAAASSARVWALTGVNNHDRLCLS